MIYYLITSKMVFLKITHFFYSLVIVILQILIIYYFYLNSYWIKKLLNLLVALTPINQHELPCVS